MIDLDALHTRVSDPIRSITYFVTQHPATNMCGQCCVAMVVNQPIETIVEDFGGRRRGRGRTSTRQIRDVLRNYGLRLSRAYYLRNRLRPPSDMLALATLHWPNSHTTHWVLLDHGRVIDPLAPHDSHTVWPPGTRMTSYHTITPMMRATIRAIYAGSND